MLAFTPSSGKMKIREEIAGSSCTRPLLDFVESPPF